MDKNLILMATHKAVSAESFRGISENVEPGDYPIDFTVRITGSIRKGQPYSQTNAAAANPWKALAVALSKLNAKTAEAVIRESLTISDADAKRLKAEADELIQKLVEPTREERSGKVTAILSLSEVV